MQFYSMDYMGQQYFYTVDPSADEPVMLINRNIGFDSTDGQGIDGAAFQQELMQLDSLGKKSIQVWINSVGGVVMDGYNICSAILKSKTPVDTFCVGVAASIAGVIFMTGRKRVMADYSMMMIHKPSGGDDKKALAAMGDSLTTILSAKSTIDKENVDYLMDRTTWLPASECFDKGFCTEIEVTSKANQKRMAAAKEPTAKFKAANLILNSFLPTEKNTDMSLLKVTMKLGLNEAATEDNIISAIKTIEDRAYNAELAQIAAEKKLTDITNASKKEAKELEDKIAACEKDLEEMKQKYKLVKDELDAKNKAKKEAEEEEMKAKAKTEVENAVKLGKIKNDSKVIEKFTNLFITDPVTAKELIDELPVNKTAPVIPVMNKVQGIDATSALALSVRNKLKREGKISNWRRGDN